MGNRLNTDTGHLHLFYTFDSDLRSYLSPCITILYHYHYYIYITICHFMNLSPGLEEDSTHICPGGQAAAEQGQSGQGGW